MQEFRDSIDKIGIKQSPIASIKKLKIPESSTEGNIFILNILLFVDSIDHLRDCIDCYFVMCRQKDRQPIKDHFCYDLLQFIARARYNLGQLFETLRILEQNIDSKVILIDSRFNIFQLQWKKEVKKPDTSSNQGKETKLQPQSTPKYEEDRSRGKKSHEWFIY
jgi:hypothetical protein